MLLNIALFLPSCFQGNKKTKDMETISQLVVAQAILRPASGKSFLADSATVTTDNVKQYTPPSRSVKQAIRSLEKAGFRVSPAAFSLTLEGPPALFETYFKMKLSPFDSLYGYQAKVPAKVPESLSKYVEQVVFPEPPQYFEDKGQK